MLLVKEKIKTTKIAYWGGKYFGLKVKRRLLLSKTNIFPPYKTFFLQVQMILSKLGTYINLLRNHFFLTQSIICMRETIEEKNICYVWYGNTHTKWGIYRKLMGVATSVHKSTVLIKYIWLVSWKTLLKYAVILTLQFSQHYSCLENCKIFR